MKRRLNAFGYEITASQLTRIIKERPERISTDLLDHLLTILHCQLTDLLRLDPVTQDDENAC
ncbi:helix-turn-helix domain-containing protein [Ferrovum myxofaciens]|uniref:Helix-turn-helix transcriptional regulator n=1 Tax=Ferrovum myxofaciens TaxID=416213 RepID=A0A9E6MZ89_9PROT|nr:helix-turn-helix transcriptional regulator [Ferrovum myxofaciens]QWY77805.1 MAG: helix-turn-helix transcriptional regulator [Ferrovum myxofaciens]